MHHPGATAAVCMHLTSSIGMSLGCMGTWAPVLLDTNTFLTQSHPSTASSTVSFRGMVFPPRTAWSVVITTLAEAVEMEEESEEGIDSENCKTTNWHCLICLSPPNPMNTVTSELKNILIVCVAFENRVNKI